MIPASIRNNNPGAMYPGKSSKKFGSRTYEVLKSKDGVHKIATFPTAIHGAAAQFDLLHRSYRNMTIEKAIAKWCGGFYVSTYIKVLETEGGVKRTDILTSEVLKNTEAAIPLAKAMAQQEAGREFPLKDDEWEAAHQMAFGNAVAPAFAPDNDVPSPKEETRKSEVAKTFVPVVGAATVGGGASYFGVPVPSIDTVIATAQSPMFWQIAGAALAYVVICHILPRLVKS